MCVLLTLLGFEGGIRDWIVLIPEHCLSVTFQVRLSKTGTLKVLSLAIRPKDKARMANNIDPDQFCTVFRKCIYSNT